MAAVVGGIKGFFRNKILPLIRMFPRALLAALLTGWIYWFLVSGPFKFYIYLIGVLIAIPGYYVAVWLQRKIKEREYDAEYIADEGAEEG